MTPWGHAALSPYLYPYLCISLPCDQIMGTCTLMSCDQTDQRVAKLLPQLFPSKYRNTQVSGCSGSSRGTAAALYMYTLHSTQLHVYHYLYISHPRHSGCPLNPYLYIYPYLYISHPRHSGCTLNLYLYIYSYLYISHPRHSGCALSSLPTCCQSPIERQNPLHSHDTRIEI